MQHFFCVYLFIVCVKNDELMGKTSLEYNVYVYKTSLQSSGYQDGFQARNAHNYSRGREKFRPNPQMDRDTDGNRPFNRVPCSNIIQANLNDPAASWLRKKSEDDRSHEELLNMRDYLTYNRPTDNEVGQTSFLQDKEGT